MNLVVNKIPFISTNLDLCDVASMAGLSCPISAGQQVLKVSQQIPNEAPSVSINFNNSIAVPTNLIEVYVLFHHVGILKF